MIRTNLITNSTFSSGTTGWTATSSASLTALTTGGIFGNYCLQVTKAAATNSGVYSGASAATTVGLTYVASAYVKIPTGEATGDFKVGIAFFDSGNSAVGSTQYSSTTSIADGDGWVRVYKSYTAPATSTYAKIYVVQATAGTAGKKFLVDGVQFENASEPTPFIETLTQSEENTRVNNTLRKVPSPHLTGMELNADIMINDLLLNTVDENNIVWVCTDIQGWWGLPDPEVPDLTRGLDDGSYDVRGRFTARNITLAGSALVPSRDYTKTARDKLIAAINLVHTGGWMFVDEDPTKASYVRLSGRPSIEVTNARGRIDFSVGLRAANPIKFKWNWNDTNGYETTTVTNGSSATITNDGNINVPVILTLTGGLTAPVTITNSTAGETLTIVKDLRTTSYSKNIAGVSRTSNVTTVTTSGTSSHGFFVGDVVNIDYTANSGGIADAANATITATTTTTFSYADSGSNVAALTTTTGTVTLGVNDSLEIDTYNKSATLNGSALVARAYIDALVDWITLSPGDNTIAFADAGGTTDLTVKHRSGWIG